MRRSYPPAPVPIFYGPPEYRYRAGRPTELEPLNPRKDAMTPAPTEHGDQFEQGFARLSTADPRTGTRPAIGGEPVFPPYHPED